MEGAATLSQVRMNGMASAAARDEAHVVAIALQPDAARSVPREPSISARFATPLALPCLILVGVSILIGAFIWLAFAF
jgi:hypothetical protein